MRGATSPSQTPRDGESSSQSFTRELLSRAPRTAPASGLLPPPCPSEASNDLPSLLCLSAGCSLGKEQKLSRRVDHFREKDSSLAFVDPALSIFDLSTPKYKMTPVDESTHSAANGAVTSSYWENSFLKATPETRIIDYMATLTNARDGFHHRGGGTADVNIETPTRPVPTRLDMGTPDSHEDHSSFLSKNVIKALNFGTSIDGDMSVIMKETDASIIDLSDAEDLPEIVLSSGADKDLKDVQTPNYNELKELAPPTQDTSPDSAVLKESELKSELLTKFSRNALTSPSFTRDTTKQQNCISPVKEKEECEFTRHLTSNIGYADHDRDVSFVDALSTEPHIKKHEGGHNPAAPVTRLPHQVSPSRPEKKVQEPVVEREELVDEWKETKTPQGKIYFYNRRTRQSSWK